MQPELLPGRSRSSSPTSKARRGCCRSSATGTPTSSSSTAARYGRPAPPQEAAKPAHREAAGALGGGAGALGSFLQSRQGKQLEKQVVRGVFGLLKKSL
jgi:hypothetical protein